MKAVMQTQRRGGIFLSSEVKFLILSLSQIHTVSRRRLINFILFTSELSFLKISSPGKMSKKKNYMLHLFLTIQLSKITNLNFTQILFIGFVG